MTKETFRETAEESGVLDVKDDFLDPAFRMECDRLIPNFNNIVANDCREAYLYLKHNLTYMYLLKVSVILKQPKFGHCNQQFVTGIRHYFQLKQSVYKSEKKNIKQKLNKLSNIFCYY